MIETKQFRSSVEIPPPQAYTPFTVLTIYRQWCGHADQKLGEHSIFDYYEPEERIKLLQQGSEVFRDMSQRARILTQLKHIENRSSPMLTQEEKIAVRKGLLAVESEDNPLIKEHGPIVRDLANSFSSLLDLSACDSSQTDKLFNLEHETFAKFFAFFQRLHERDGLSEQQVYGVYNGLFNGFEWDELITDIYPKFNTFDRGLFATLYAYFKFKSTYPGSKITLGDPSQERMAVDLIVDNTTKPLLIQVKGVDSPLPEESEYLSYYDLGDPKQFAEFSESHNQDSVKSAKALIETSQKVKATPLWVVVPSKPIHVGQDLSRYDSPVFYWSYLFDRGAFDEQPSIDSMHDRSYFRDIDYGLYYGSFDIRNKFSSLPEGSTVVDISFGNITRIANNIKKRHERINYLGLVDNAMAVGLKKDGNSYSTIQEVNNVSYLIESPYGLLFPTSSGEIPHPDLIIAHNTLSYFKKDDNLSFVFLSLILSLSENGSILIHEQDHHSYERYQHILDNLSPHFNLVLETKKSKSGSRYMEIRKS